MATVENLERLAGLVKSLQPLANKQRGELIEAAQWNLLVDGVLEVARASLAEGAVETVPAHKHTDMVDVEWLTPKLRALVLEGGLSDPAAEAQLTKLGRRLDRLSQRVEDLAGKLGRLQADLSSVQTKDIVRQDEVAKLGLQLDGVRDSRDDVARLRASLDTLSADVRIAVAAADSLQRDGEAIDVGALVGRVDELEGLREALTTPAGAVLSAGEYERRLEQLRAELVTRTELRDVLNGVRDEFGELDADAVREDARLAGRAAADQAIATFRTETTAELDRRFAGIDATIDARFDTATTDLAGTVLGQSRGEWQPALDNGLATLERQIAAAEADRDAATRGALRNEIAALDASLPDRIAGAAREASAAALADLGTQVDGLAERNARLETQAAANATAIGQLSTRVETTRRTLEAADAQLQASLTTRISRLEEGLDRRIDARNAVLRDSLLADLRTDINALGRDLESRLNRTVREAVVTEVRTTSGRLRNEISSVIDAEVAAVREDINVRTERGLNSNASRLSGLVTNEVRRATSDLDGRIERAVNSFRPEIERIVAGRPILPPSPNG